MKPKRYDIFISYDGKDRSWAAKLAASLEKKNLTVFWDRKLEAGLEWHPELLEALDNSQFFLALWSKNAVKEQWVWGEAARFDQNFNKTGEDPTGHRRLLFLQLDEESKPYAHLQQITELKDADAYAPGPANIDPALWDSIVEKIHQISTETAVATPVSLLILTTTLNRLQKLDPRVPADHLDTAPPLDDLLGAIGVTWDELLQRYHETDRTAWRPYGTDTVMQMLNEKRDRINRLLKTVGGAEKPPSAMQFRWEPVGGGFWSGDIERVALEVKKVLAPRLAVVVVDPVALYDGQVYNRFNRIRDCLGNERAVVLVLPPFRMPPAGLAFRESVERIELSLFRGCYEPGVHRMPHAHCSLSFDEDLDIQRSVLATLRHYCHQLAPKASNPYTEIGSEAH